jgi:CBS domain-containing protein
MSDVPMIGQMSITDEHELVPVKTKMKQILNILREDPATAVILHNGNKKNMKIVGVLTAEEIDAAVEGGANPKKLKIEDVMLTKILEVPSDVPVTRAIEVIQEKGPDAVIVRHRDGDFAGYFSVSDFHEAKDIIAQQQEKAQQFQQNAKGFGDRASDLQQQLEDDGDDDDDSYIPEAMRGLPLSPQMKSTFKAQAQGGAAKSGGPPSRGPPSRGPPRREPEPEPEPEPVAPAPQGPSRGGPSRPGGGPPDRPPSGGGGVTNVAGGTNDMTDVGGHLMIEATGAASGPSGPSGPAQRAGPSDPLEDIDIGGAARGQRPGGPAQRTGPSDPLDAIDIGSAAGGGQNEEADNETWSMVKDSMDPSDIQFYLDNFPNGKYAIPARLKLKQLSR